MIQEPLDAQLSAQLSKVIGCKYNGNVLRDLTCMHPELSWISDLDDKIEISVLHALLAGQKGE
jgi:hypothetical protein